MFLLCTLLVLLLINRDDAVTEIDVEESLTLRLQSSCDPTDTSIFQRVVNANLENYGYTKDVVIKIVTTPDHKPTRHVMFSFHKKTNCNRSLEVEKEMDYYFAGLLNFELIERLAVEMEGRHFDHIPFCRVGIKVHFQENSPHHRAQRQSGWIAKSFLFRPFRESLKSMPTLRLHRKRDLPTPSPKTEEGVQTTPPYRLHSGATNQFGSFEILEELDNKKKYSCSGISVHMVAEIP